MLLAAIYTTRNPTEESQKRSLQLFTNWQPPAEFKAHYTRADGKGGIALFEAEDASVALEMVGPFTAFFDFEITPVVNSRTRSPCSSRRRSGRSPSPDALAFPRSAAGVEAVAAPVEGSSPLARIHSPRTRER